MTRIPPFWDGSDATQVEGQVIVVDDRYFLSSLKVKWCLAEFVVHNGKSLVETARQFGNSFIVGCIGKGTSVKVDVNWNALDASFVVD